ncbi:DUF6527 family protein [Lacibacterium aquatile]|uniref:DUF6527 family protein n=1 Tax=Lacibacterium aquatile TaxID=1168082 RepID=A0ABW5DSC6_9PROT
MIGWLKRACTGLKGHWRRLWEDHGPARRLQVVETDSLPAKMPARDLVLTQDDGEPWSLGMRCPCGCGDTLELLVIKEARPRWDLQMQNGKPTLHPSVWRQTGCRAHFWLREGRVHWCS